jgi:hypothetical protein
MKVVVKGEGGEFVRDVGRYNSRRKRHQKSQAGTTKCKR